MSSTERLHAAREGRFLSWDLTDEWDLGQKRGRTIPGRKGCLEEGRERLACAVCAGGGGL